eukprot:8185669-Heterocapsa_arctica.AAC.1
MEIIMPDDVDWQGPTIAVTLEEALKEPSVTPSNARSSLSSVRFQPQGSIIFVRISLVSCAVRGTASAADCELPDERAVPKAWAVAYPGTSRG